MLSWSTVPRRAVHPSEQLLRARRSLASPPLPAPQPHRRAAQLHCEAGAVQRWCRLPCVPVITSKDWRALARQ
uniref:Uncharacterized protein n=1 Tax=Arundo donax TaxID=35708 RepID=A0A0A9CYS2_ARUDO